MLNYLDAKSTAYENDLNYKRISENISMDQIGTVLRKQSLLPQLKFRQARIEAEPLVETSISSTSQNKTDINLAPTSKGDLSAIQNASDDQRDQRRSSVPYISTTSKPKDRFSTLSQMSGTDSSESKQGLFSKLKIRSSHRKESIDGVATSGSSEYGDKKKKGWRIWRNGKDGKEEDMIIESSEQHLPEPKIHGTNGPRRSKSHPQLDELDNAKVKSNQSLDKKDDNQPREKSGVFMYVILLFAIKTYC